MTWPRFCVLAALLFVFRGVFVLSVLPPFEGWDEYQHAAYIQFLIENGRPPSWARSDEVPRSIYPALVRYPQSRFAVDQLRHVGTLTYEEYWKRDRPPGVAPDAPGIHLYQAQHNALYYRLVAPIFAKLWVPEAPLAAVSALRLVNVLFGAAAVLLVGLTLGRVIRDAPGRPLLLLLVAAQPLLLLNCARVANDALAFFLGTLAVCGLLLWSDRAPRLVGLMAGAVVGAAVLAKAVNLALVPFGLFLFLMIAWRRRISRGAAGVAAALFLAGVLSVAGSTLWSNLKTYGLLTPMQEAAMNREAGRTMGDLIRSALQVDWADEFWRRYVRRILWRGGWSFLSPPSWMQKWHGAVVLIAVIGWCMALRRSVRARRNEFTRPGDASCLVVLCLSAAAGLAYHLVQGMAALGTAYTNVWYAAVSFPWLLCLFWQGAAYYPRAWMRVAPCAALLFVYVSAEVYGTLGRMVETYAGVSWGPLARERLGEIHPDWLGPSLTLPALAAALALMALSLAAVMASARAPRV